MNDIDELKHLRRVLLITRGRVARLDFHDRDETLLLLQGRAFADAACAAVGSVRAEWSDGEMDDVNAGLDLAVQLDIRRNVPSDVHDAGGLIRRLCERVERLERALAEAIGYDIDKKEAAE